MLSLKDRLDQNAAECSYVMMFKLFVVRDIHFRGDLDRTGRIFGLAVVRGQNLLLEDVQLGQALLRSDRKLVHVNGAQLRGDWTARGVVAATFKLVKVNATQ